MRIGMDKQELAAGLRAFFGSRPEVVLAYLFGSTARGTTGPLSDVDVAVSLSGPEQARFGERLKLHDALCRHLGSDRVDLVDLDTASPVLRYNVIRDGIALKGADEVRVPFEVRAMSEYMGTEALRRPHELKLMASVEQARP